MDDDFDKKMMERAIALAEKARFIAPPNPWVGCVIAKGTEIIGEGFTSPPGSSHAEVNALKQAGRRAEGSTAYVTLEPCCHYGRTPPCTKALIASKIKRVVIGLQDPDSCVSGKGIAELKAAGIQVDLQLCKEKISSLLAPYMHHRKTGLPYCIGKAAVSIDGRIAAEDGSSQWLTGEEARRDVHSLRAESQAILIGAGTAVKDHPSLTVRDSPERPLKPPLRVVLDAKGVVKPPTPLFDLALASTLIITTESCDKSTWICWQQQGIETAIVNPASDGRGVNLSEVLKLLGERGVVQLLIEGGGRILGSFLEEKLLQQLTLYIAPCILGNRGIPLFQLEGVHTLSQAPRLNVQSFSLLGSSMRLDYSLF